MADEDTEEWRFGLDELDGGDTSDTDTEASDGSTHEHHEGDSIEGESATAVVGGVGADQPIEPGSPRLENVVFVVLGALAAGVLVADFLSLAGF